MTPHEQLNRFMRYDEDELFTAALQLLRRTYDEVVDGEEEAAHGNLTAAIDDLCLGPWCELEEPLVAQWPYPVGRLIVSWLLDRLLEVSTRPRAKEVVVTVRWSLRPGGSSL